ncbi:MAG: hypothetical protein IKH77_03320 [Clostridia bacterium]|nr:hypothetical protein [Clostridia bacterium]
MYKLLLVTDKPEVRAAFDAVTDWERLGFKQPRTAASADEATDSLTHHHADAVAIALPAEEEKKLLSAMECPHWHLRPVLDAADTKEQVLKDMVELELLLSRTHADYSNDPYSEETMMQLARHEFFRRVISGKTRSPERIRRYLRLLRSRMDPTRPCVLLRLAIPDDDGYLSAHWHYGADRLEVAMRNIFGAELSGMRLLVSVLDSEEIYLLACPMLEHEAPEAGEMERIVVEHATWACQHVREYLDMELEIDSVRMLSCLYDLAVPETAE